MNNYVGVDIGGTKLKIGIVSKEGTLIDFKVYVTPTSKVKLTEKISEYIKEASCNIVGIGFSVPGVIKDNGYTLTSGAVKYLLNLNLKKEFEDYFNLPVSVENDGRCAALAEKWIGAAKWEKNFVVITLGTAIGGAVFFDGKLQRGFSGLTGSFGLMLATLSENELKEKTFDYHAATVGGLCRQYSYRVKEKVLDAKEIIFRAKNNDEIAKECLNNFCYAVAILCINIAVSLNPESIYLGGGISENKEIISEIKSKYLKIIDNIKVLGLLEMSSLKVCESKNNAGLIGAVYSHLHL
ncbi:MAG: ROK family protein [Erysipelotrichaceae bacterium]